MIYFLYFLLLSERRDRIGIFVRYLRYPNFGLWSFIGILVGSCRIIGIDFNIGGPFSNRRIYGQFMTALGIMMINQWIFFIIMDRGFVCFVCPFFHEFHHKNNEILLSIFTNNYNHYHNLSIIILLAVWMFLAIHSSALSDGSDDLDQVELYFDDGFHQHVSKVGVALFQGGDLNKRTKFWDINVINP